MCFLVQHNNNKKYKIVSFYCYVGSLFIIDIRYVRGVFYVCMFPLATALVLDLCHECCLLKLNWSTGNVLDASVAYKLYKTNRKITIFYQNETPMIIIIVI